MTSVVEFEGAELIYSIYLPKIPCDDSILLIWLQLDLVGAIKKPRFIMVRVQYVALLNIFDVETQFFDSERKTKLTKYVLK